MIIQKEKIKLWINGLKSEIIAVYFSLKHNRTPLYAKIIAVIVVGYALSPIDLIPDFIPILGYLDDFILLPLGLMLAISLIPADIMRECREQAKYNPPAVKPKIWLTAYIIIAIWVGLLYTLICWFYNK